MTDDSFDKYKLLLLKMAEDGVTNFKELAKSLADHENESDKRLDKIEQDLVAIKTKIYLASAVIATVFSGVVYAILRHLGG